MGIRFRLTNTIFYVGNSLQLPYIAELADLIRS
jgi:hypothetical protein